MAEFNPGAWAFSHPTNYNFASLLNTLKPDVSDKLYHRYCNNLVGLLAGLNKTRRCNIEYSHFETTRSYPKIQATTTGAGAGAAATFTFAPAPQLTSVVGLNGQQFDITQQSPYVASTPASYVAGVPVREQDTILIKPVAGSVNADTYIRAIVVSVDAGAGTFVAIPLDSADSIPAIATPDEIIIYGNAWGEGTCSPEGLNEGVEEIKNNMQIFKDSQCITETYANLCHWFKVGDKLHFSLNNEESILDRMYKYIELTLLLGEQFNNPLIQNDPAHPVKMTRGLIPTVLAEGTVQSYSAVTGYGVPEFEDLILNLEAEKSCDSEYWIMAGTRLSFAIDKAMKQFFDGGGVTYGSFNGCEPKTVGLGFDSFCWGGYTFHKKKWDLASDVQTLNATGYTFQDEGLIIPMGMVKDARSGENMNHLQVNYLYDNMIQSSYVDQFDVNGCSNRCVYYRAELGLEVFGANSFGYIKLQ